MKFFMMTMLLVFSMSAFATQACEPTPDEPLCPQPMEDPDQWD